MFTLHNTSTALEAVIKAVNYAAIKHKDQRRRDVGQTPYINHPIGVASILIEEGKLYDPTLIQAAILKDTVEDTDATPEEIERNFGVHVRQIVTEMTDDQNLHKHERRRAQIEKAREKCREAQLIRLADKLYNIRDLEKNVPVNWTDREVNEFYKFAKQVVDQIRGVHPILERKFDEAYKRRQLS